jgi:hypothetical protein
MTGSSPKSPKVSKKAEVRNKGNKSDPARAGENPTSEITMEVHHHPDLNHKRKPWKEYFLEFIMIFLAVTMGFFAETIRESISDTAKGREYIRSFVQDLRTDTADFSNIIAYDEKKTRGLSGLSTCVDTIDKNPKTTSCLVPLVKSSSSNRHVGFIDGTMQQLKNAGGFRLLTKDDKDSIVAYDHAVGSYKDFEATVFQERQNTVRNECVKLMNFKAFEMLLPDSLKSDINIPLLFSNDKELLNEYFNDLFLYRRVITNQVVITKNLKKRAAGIIKYFDNKYNLVNAQE